MNIEDDLRRALRAEDPGAAFTQRVLARAREERTRGSQTRTGAATGGTDAGGIAPAVSPSREHDDVRREAGGTGSRTRTWTARRLVAALAASTVIAAGGVQLVQHRRYVAEGERARAQVLAALRLTSEQLRHVHEAIQPPGDAR